MNTTADRTSSAARDAKAAIGGRVDLKLEAIVIPVSDVDRAKKFYPQLGWRLDADFAFDNGFRVVQLTPPGSECSIQFGTNVIDAARAELVARGVAVSEVFHAETPGAQLQPEGTMGRVRGAAPDHASYSRHDARGASSATAPRSARRAIWRVRCGVPRPLMASTRGARVSATRSGPTGTPRTWWPIARRAEGSARQRHRGDLQGARRLLRRRPSMIVSITRSTPRRSCQPMSFGTAARRSSSSPSSSPCRRPPARSSRPALATTIIKASTRTCRPVRPTES